MIRKYALLAIVAGFMAACGGAAGDAATTGTDTTAAGMMEKGKDAMNNMNESVGNAMDTIKAVVDTTAAKVEGAVDAAKDAANNMTSGH